MITRWIAYIQLYDFNLRHVPGRMHDAADGLSRHGSQPGDTDIDITSNIEGIIDVGLSQASVGPLRPKIQHFALYRSEVDTRRILREEYSNNSEYIT